MVFFHADLFYGATISLQTKFSLSAEAPVLADGGSLKWLIGIYCHISCKEESKVIKVILKVFIIEQFIVRPVLGPGQEVTWCSGNTVGDKCGACQQYLGHVHSQHNIFGIETLWPAGRGCAMPPPASPAWTVLSLLASLPTSTLPSAQMPRSASDRGIIIAQLC